MIIRKRLYLCFFLLVLFFILLFPDKIYSHPLDISYTTLTPQKNGLLVETYIHPYELNLLLKERGFTILTASHTTIRKILFPYYLRHFNVADTNNKRIPVKKIDFEKKPRAHILAYGLYITGFIETQKQELIFNITLFNTYFTTQANKLLLLSKDGTMPPGHKEIWLTNKRISYTLNLNNPDFSKDTDSLEDTDKDGLTDHQEKLFGLDIHNPDTDGDGFSDFDELSFGWDPLNKKPGKNQTFAYLKKHGGGSSAMLQKQLAKKNSDKDKQQVKPVRPYSQKYGSPLLGKTLQYLVNFFSTKQDRSVSIITILFFVFLLGFVHAASAGHGKGIMISYLTDSNQKLRDAFVFITVFTIIHLLDVILIGVAVYALDKAVDNARVTNILQNIGGTGILIFSVAYIVYGFYRLKKQTGSTEDTSLKETPGKTITWKGVGLAFLVGLAPCPFGWALFMVLMGLGKTALIVPFILVFGIGIYCFLLLFGIIFIFFKNKLYGKVNWVEKYSVLLSGFLMLIFSLMFFTPTLRLF